MKRYRVYKTIRFANFSVQRGEVFETPRRIPVWVRSLLVGTVPLKIRGRVRLVSEHEVVEIK